MSEQEKVTLTIDGKKVSVPKGTNLIEAAKMIGVEVPHYCYHPDLSIAGNCRMCQVEVKGRPKLEIGCNCTALEGMEVSTQQTSQKVADAQAATLEFILINHPLDCTVCDQAGHCKLQDYHYEYNARSSRFIEEKEHKVKAEVLGPHVILDGERCIMCTRCIRFCEEVTETNELCMLNRGDKSVIAVHQDNPLDNPLSGSVVDLCPVGALTHRDWRFNTRIWFTDRKNSICTGCSTGCNVQVATRDNQVVQVKARYNKEVNKEWLCDEGRYGFMRFQPESRILRAQSINKELTLELAIKELSKLKATEAIVFVAPDLSYEDYSVIKSWLEQDIKPKEVVLAYRQRKLTETEARLISPDYAANFRGALFSGLIKGVDSEVQLEAQYIAALERLSTASVKSVLFIGDRSLTALDISTGLTDSVKQIAFSAFLGSDSNHALKQVCSLVIPIRTPLEVSGLMINRSARLQYMDRLLEAPDGVQPVWRIINSAHSKRFTAATSDRDMTVELLAKEALFAGITIAQIKGSNLASQSSDALIDQTLDRSPGVDLTNRTKSLRSSASVEARV